MRKLLLATTALAGAALCGAAEANMEVTVGGYNDFRAGFTGQDLSAGPATGRRSNDFQNEFQLEVEAKNKTSNGLEYGAVATLWNGAQFGGTQQANNVNFHQTYGYVNGSWGQVRAGDEHGASDFEVAAPLTYDFGAQIDGNYTEFLRAQDVFAIAPSFIDDDENSTKISYLTPKLGMGAHKVQLGVSYAPNLYGQGDHFIALNNNTAAGTAYKNLVKIGGQYNGSFMDKVNATLGFVVQTAEGTNGNVGTLAGTARDFTSWDVGAQLGYAGFTVGGNYTDAGRFNTTAAQNADQHVWSAGATYKFDRASVGGSYLSGRGYNNQRAVAGATGFSNAAVAGGTARDVNYVDSYEVWGIGAGYSLFEGMTTSVDTAFFKQERPS
ncbi:MAG: porin, partial [Alphaproteobacteria bacterium]|nr:porin [Alphaproteobacteria bacterium]